MTGGRKKRRKKEASENNTRMGERVFYIHGKRGKAILIG